MSRKLFSAITLFTLVIFSALPAGAQAAPRKQATGESSASPMQTQSAVSTGAAHTAVLDGENGPIVFSGRGRKSRIDSMASWDGPRRRAFHPRDGWLRGRAS